MTKILITTCLLLLNLNCCLHSQVYLKAGIGLSTDKYLPIRAWEPEIEKLQKPFSTLSISPVLGIRYLFSNFEVSSVLSYSERKFQFLTKPSNGFPPVDYYYYRSFDYALKFGYTLGRNISVGTILQYSKLSKIRFTYEGLHEQKADALSDSYTYFIGYYLGWRLRNVDIKAEYLPHSFIFPKNKPINPLFYPIRQSQRIQLLMLYSFKLFEVKHKKKADINCPKF